MKKLLVLLILITGFYTSIAQPHLQISSITGAPFNPTDSVIYEFNSYDSILFKVVNLDTVVFSDNLQILIQANSRPLDSIYYDSIPTTILPGDTALLNKPGYFFQSAHFDDGDNIIVVWPQALQTPLQGDSITMHVYYVSISSDIGKIKNDVLTIYPNPSNSFISFNLPDGISIKQVRISDENGRLIYHNQKIEKFISTDNWIPGTYFLEVEKSNGTVQQFRIIKN